jgi:thiamine kinase-like enzyme
MLATDKLTDLHPGPHGRRLGQAQDRTERAVEEVILRVPEWQGHSVHYAPMLGGLQNSNWRLHVEDDDRQYFLKIPGDGTEAFIDRSNSNAAAARAGNAGISPAIVAFFPDTGAEIIEFLEGYRACTNGDVKDWEITKSIIGLYQAFHSVDPLPVTKTMFDMIDEHLHQVNDLGVILPANMPGMLRELEAARSALTASGLDLVPCHNDPMPGNFLIAPEKPMRLVDFEFASNNERAYDLAVIVTEFFYDESRTMECIEEFYGSARWDLVSRVNVCSALADIKWGLWGCVNQQLNDNWDFDYHKYGTWKLARARAKIGDPRWPLWLSAL